MEWWHANRPLTSLHILHTAIEAAKGRGAREVAQNAVLALQVLAQQSIKRARALQVGQAPTPFDRALATAASKEGPFTAAEDFGATLLPRPPQPASHVTAADAVADSILQRLLERPSVQTAAALAARDTPLPYQQRWWAEQTIRAWDFWRALRGGVEYFDEPGPMASMYRFLFGVQLYCGFQNVLYGVAVGGNRRHEGLRRLAAQIESLLRAAPATLSAAFARAAPLGESKIQLVSTAAERAADMIEAASPFEWRSAPGLVRKLMGERRASGALLGATWVRYLRDPESAAGRLLGRTYGIAWNRPPRNPADPLAPPVDDGAGGDDDDAAAAGFAPVMVPGDARAYWGRLMTGDAVQRDDLRYLLWLRQSTWASAVAVLMAPDDVPSPAVLVTQAVLREVSEHPALRDSLLQRVRALLQQGQPWEVSPPAAVGATVDAMRETWQDALQAWARVAGYDIRRLEDAWTLFTRVCLARLWYNLFLHWRVVLRAIEPRPAVSDTVLIACVRWAFTAAVAQRRRTLAEVPPSLVRAIQAMLV